jgi:hypothetical protein
VPGTHVVIRATGPGTNARCEDCKEHISFSARKRGRHVIVNVYVTEADANLIPGEGNALMPGNGGVWDRVVLFHAVCYEEAGEPFGEPAAADWQPEVQQQRRRKAAKR